MQLGPSRSELNEAEVETACNTPHIALLDHRRLNGGVIWRWGRAAPRKWRYKLTKSTFLRAGRALELVFRAGWGRGFLGGLSSLY